MTTKIVALSDTHERHEGVEVPECDLLIFAGDATVNGDPKYLQAFSDWFDALPARHKVMIAGNHDRSLDVTHYAFTPSAMTALPTAEYLDSSPLEIEGLRIWGDPITPFFHSTYWAFHKHRGPELEEHWSHIPEGLDILITHGPPYAILDVPNPPHSQVNAGDEYLAKAIELKRPKVHIFGHIHGGHGVLQTEHTTHRNVAICDEAYHPINPVHVFEL